MTLECGSIKTYPGKWQIKFEVKKRRAGKAPEGSGAPVGTDGKMPAAISAGLVMTSPKKKAAVKKMPAKKKALKRLEVSFN